MNLICVNHTRQRTNTHAHTHACVCIHGIVMCNKLVLYCMINCLCLIFTEYVNFGVGNQMAVSPSSQFVRIL